MLSRIALAFIMWSSAQTSSCATGGVDCPIPQTGRWIPYDQQNLPEHRIMLEATVLPDGRVVWGRNIISERQLTIFLRRAREMNPAPYLVLQYRSSLPCPIIARFRSIFEIHGGCGDITPCSERPLPDSR